MLTQAHTKPLRGADYNTLMVSVAQLVERRTVTAKAAGSIPVGHPKDSLPMNYLDRYDRTQMCQHRGMLTASKPDGTRRCIRCGEIMRLAAPTETFTQPVSLKADGLKRKLSLGS